MPRASRRGAGPPKVGPEKGARRRVAFEVLPPVSGALPARGAVFYGEALGGQQRQRPVQALVRGQADPDAVALALHAAIVAETRPGVPASRPNQAGGFWRSSVVGPRMARAPGLGGRPVRAGDGPHSRVGRPFAPPPCAPPPLPRIVVRARSKRLLSHDRKGSIYTGRSGVRGAGRKERRRSRRVRGLISCSDV